MTGDVGKAGVAIDSVEDMKILFDQIPLDKVSVSMTMNGAGAAGAGGLRGGGGRAGRFARPALGNHSERHSERVHGRNTYIYPPKPSMRIIGDIIGYTARNMPKFNSISISGYHMQEAGANQALELAFTLADGKEYVKTAIASGLDVDAFAGRLSFFWAIGMNFYLKSPRCAQPACCGAASAKETGAKNPKSLMLRTHCQTSAGRSPSRTLQQHRAHHHRGHGAGVWRHPKPAHQCARRSHCAAHGI